MRVVILPTELEASNFAGQFIADYINEKNNPVIGLATGGSVLLTYEALINSIKKGSLALERLVTFNLDEYIGLSQIIIKAIDNYMKKNYLIILILIKIMHLFLNVLMNNLTQHAQTMKMK